MAGGDADDPDADVPTATPGPRPPRGALPRGTTIGRYVLLDVLGAGGMGVVYRAYDPELDRGIALKLVKSRGRDRAVLLAEAQALARVTHPNVVSVHDVGTYDGSVFIAMELAPGPTILAWRRDAHPARADVIDVFVAAGRGLAAAHKAGVVHRDFKPSNVIVGDDGRVRVVDFGLARAGDRSAAGRARPDALPPTPTPTTRSPHPHADAAALASSDAGGGPAPLLTGADTVREPAARPDHGDDDPLSPSTPTDEGSLPQVIASRAMGTPSYMAPEQRRAGVYDARVDQFAFGVALYESLYGERPFDGATDAALQLSELADRVRPPPKGSDVPAYLRRALLRALRADPAERFPSIDALVDAIAVDRAARRRRRAAAAAAAILAVAAAVVLVRRGGAASPCDAVGRELDGVWDGTVAGAVDRALRATGRPYAADVSRRVADQLGARARRWTEVRADACRARADDRASPALLDREDACLDHRRAELAALTSALARGPDVAVLDHAPTAVAALPAVDACADRDALLAVPLPADRAVAARVAALRRRLAAIDATVWTGQSRTAQRDARAALADARATGYAPVVAEALMTAGAADRMAGDQARAEATLYDAADRAAAARDDLLAARAWIELVALVGYDRQHPTQGKVLFHAAEAALARAGDPPDQRARLLEAESLVLSVGGDLDGAIARARAALALSEKSGDDLAVSDSVNGLAMLTSDRGDYAGAEQLQRRALDLRRRLLGDGNPLVADALDNVGVDLYHQGKLAEAGEAYDQALAIRTAALGPDDVDVGTSYNNLGGLYIDRGDDGRAERYLERALAIWQRRLGPEHADLAIPLGNLGEIANRRGDRTRALALCGRALAVEQKADGPDDPDLAYALVCLGEAYLGRDDRAALAPLERALALRERAPGDAGELARTRFDVARALAATRGDLARARRLAGQACETFHRLGGTWTVRGAACDRWRNAHE